MNKIGKSLLSLFLAASCVGGLAACNNGSNTNESNGGNTNESNGGEQVDTTPKEINFLAIGNSHTLDTTQYIVDIAKDLGIKINLTTLVHGGYTLDQHYDSVINDSAVYEYGTNSGSQRDNIRYDVKISEVVTSGKWDYIMIQNRAAVAGFENTYSKLTEYINILRSWASEDTKFIWNMLWAYQTGCEAGLFYNYGYSQDIMYTKITDVTQKVISPRSDITYITASGTAVQNARTSFVGDNLTHDGWHLNPYGRYCAGMTLVKTITGVSIDNISYVPELMDAQKKAVAIESANNAVANPFKVTQSNYKN